MIERVTTLSDIDSLGMAWRTLYANCKANNLFLSFEWCRNWFEHFGLGRHVALAEYRNDQLATVGLFECTPTGYAFIDNEHSAWPDLLTLPSGSAPFAPFLEYMFGGSGAHSIILRGCPSAQLYADRLREAAGDRLVCLSKNAHCTRAIELTGSLDAYLRARPSKVRKELKRKLRRFAQEWPEAQFGVFREGESEQVVMSTVALVESRSWKATRGNALSTCARQSSFYRNVYRMSTPDTRGQLYTLSVNREPVAFVIGVVHGSRFYALKTAYDESFSAYSPGFVLFSSLIEELAQREPNVRSIELLGSDSRWKRELATSSTELCDYELARVSPKSWAKAFTANQIRPVVKAVVTERPELLGASRKLGNLLLSAPKRSEPSKIRSTTTLGIVRGLHGYSACVVADDGVTHNAEMLRLTTVNVDSFPSDMIEWCLGDGGRPLPQIQHLAVTDQFLQSPWRRFNCLLSHPVRATSRGSTDVQRIRNELRDLLRLYRGKFGVEMDGPKLHFVPQHLARISYALRASGFDDAAILSLGNRRECVSSWLGHAVNGHLHCYVEGHCPDSLGVAHAAVLAYCGIDPECGQESMAKLAESGDRARFSAIVSSLVRGAGPGQMMLDRSYFDHFCSSDTNYTSRFVEEFGVPRATGAEVLQHHRDVAAAFQWVIEEQILTACNQLRRRSGARRLVVCGWPTSNPRLTAAVAQSAGFSHVYLVPVDVADLCIGAACYLHDCILGLGRRPAPQQSCLDCKRECTCAGI